MQFKSLKRSVLAMLDVFANSSSQGVTFSLKCNFVRVRTRQHNVDGLLGIYLSIKKIKSLTIQHDIFAIYRQRSFCALAYALRGISVAKM